MFIKSLDVGAVPEGFLPSCDPREAERRQCVWRQAYRKQTVPEVGVQEEREEGLGGERDGAMRPH